LKELKNENTELLEKMKLFSIEKDKLNEKLKINELDNEK
jgi:hypothetical protein